MKTNLPQPVNNQDNERTIIDYNSLSVADRQRFQNAAKIGNNLRNTKAAKNGNYRAIAAGIAGVATVTAAAGAYAFTHTPKAVDVDDNDDSNVFNDFNDARQIASQQQDTPVTVEHHHHHKDVTFHTEPTQQPVNPEQEPQIEVIAVVHDDENNMNLALISVDGQPAYLVDMDNDMVFDAMLVDTNNDGEFAENEIVDLSDAHLSVHDLGGFTDPGMLAMAEPNKDYDPTALDGTEVASADDVDVDYSQEKSMEIEAVMVDPADEPEVSVLNVDENQIPDAGTIDAQEVYVMEVETSDDFGFSEIDTTGNLLGDNEPALDPAADFPVEGMDTTDSGIDSYDATSDFQADLA